MHYTHIYIASMCNVRSLPLRIMRRVNMVCSRSDCSRKFLEKANDELGWLDIRSHPLGLPSDAIRVTFSKFCSLTFAQCLELQIHMQHLHIFCIYTHILHTFIWYIYMYTYVYIPYLRIETHGSWVSIFWTCTSIWWLNSRQLVADFRGCTWGNSAELPGPLVDD